MPEPHRIPHRSAALPLLFPILLLGHGVRAQDTDDGAGTTLPPVVVTASRADLEDILSPGVVSVAYPDDVKGEHKSLPDLLDQIPGVYVRRVAGTGQYTTASIRGSAPSQVNVYIDGVPFNLASEAAADLSTISISNVERVEVYRGTVPARFSGAPLGGAINIVTKRPEGLHGSLSMGTRSYNGRQTSGSLMAPLADGSLLVGVDTERSKGNFKYKDTGVSAFNQLVYGDGTKPIDSQALGPHTDVERTRMNNSFQKDNMLVKWQDDHFVGKWAYNYLDRTMPDSIDPVPGYSHHRQDLADYSQQRHRQKQGQHELVLGWATDQGPLSLGTTLTYLDQNKRYRNEDDTSPAGIGRAWSHYQTRRYGGAADASYALGENWWFDHFLEIHAERYRETLHANASLLTPASDYIREFRRTATRLQAQNTISIRLLDSLGDLRITPTGRLERMDGPTIGSRWSPTGSPSGDYGWKPTGSLSAKMSFAEGWQVFGSYGTYNRYPTFYEIYGDGVNVVPNADSTGAAVPLQREFGHTSDAGIGWNGRLLDALTGRFRLTYFERKTKNAITYYGTPLAAKYINSGDTYTHGGELDGGLSWGSRADLQFAVTRQEGWYQKGGWYYFGGVPSAIHAGDNKLRTLNAPFLTADVRLDLHFLDKDLTTYVEAKHTGRKYIDTNQFERSLTTIDLGAHYRLPAGFRISAGVSDLFNQGPKQTLFGGTPVGHSYCSTGNGFDCLFLGAPMVQETYPISYIVAHPQQGRTFYATLAWTF